MSNQLSNFSLFPTCYCFRIFIIFRETSHIPRLCDKGIFNPVFRTCLLRISLVISSRVKSEFKIESTKFRTLITQVANQPSSNWTGAKSKMNHSLVGSFAMASVSIFFLLRHIIKKSWALVKLRSFIDSHSVSHICDYLLPNWNPDITCLTPLLSSDI